MLRQSDLRGIKLEKRGIFRRSIYFFNWYEEIFLKVYQEMLEKPDEFFSKIYKKIENPVDDYQYVHPPKPPAFHNSLECPFLTSDYKNFEIPREIKKKGVEALIEFRKWFLTVQDLPEKNPEAFQARLQARWGVIVPLNEIEKSNSGFAQIKNFSLEALITEINNLLNQAYSFQHSSNKNKEILKAFQKHAYLGLRPEPLEANNTNYSDEEVKEVLVDFETKFKKPIKNLLLEYYRVALNPDLKFEGSLLEGIGFAPCSNCSVEFITI